KINKNNINLLFSPPVLIALILLAAKFNRCFNFFK
ncbi:hypothetical protein Mgra_00007084, partial [Meloidogyne graminicola]